jgi:hypothetical protein
MIAQRFRSLAWVVGVALAALSFYIISLQVATERGRMEGVDKQIAQTRREIRRLQTELGTRASLRQLERWNSGALALGAPDAGQYLSGERDIALIDQLKPGKPGNIPSSVMVASTRSAQVGEEQAVAMLGEADDDVQKAISGAAITASAVVMTPVSSASKAPAPEARP